MSVINIRNGTPVGNAHLCQRCTWGHFITGFRESDQLVVCMRSEPNFTVPFVVYECTEFNDKHKPSWDQMTKLAIEVAPSRVSTKTRGFQVQTVAKQATQDSVDEGGGDIA